MIRWYRAGTSITRYHQGDDVGARDDPMVPYRVGTSIIRYHQGDDDVGAMIRLYRSQSTSYILFARQTVVLSTFAQKLFFEQSTGCNIPMEVPWYLFRLVLYTFVYTL